MSRYILALFLFMGSLTLFGESREFFGLGWNSQGVFGWYEMGQDERGGFYRFQLLDLVTDEVIFEERVYTRQTSGAAVASDIKERYRTILTAKEMDSMESGRSIGSRSFSFQNKRFSMLSASEEGREKLRILNLSDNSFKDVGVLPLGADSEDLAGGEISPFENRAALLWEDPTTGEHRVYGAHLLLGFQKSAYHAGELIESVLCGQWYITRNYLDRGADMELPDNRGFTPLMLAVRNGKWDIARLLAERGADTDITDDQGKHPWEYAEAAGYRELARLLR